MTGIKAESGKKRTSYLLKYPMAHECTLTFSDEFKARKHFIQKTV